MGQRKHKRDDRRRAREEKRRGGMSSNYKDLWFPLEDRGRTGIAERSSRQFFGIHNLCLSVRRNP